MKARSKCGCRIGIAKAPEFLCSATGFSFRSMVDAASETTISETTPTSNTHPGDTNSAPSSFRISDLRPLLYPRMPLFFNATFKYITSHSGYTAEPNKL